MKKSSTLCKIIGMIKINKNILVLRSETKKNDTK